MPSDPVSIADSSTAAASAAEPDADDSSAAHPNTVDATLADLSYERARDELISVVSRLEQGTPTLEESLALWERGEALARRCEEWLIGAKARLDAARAGADGPAGPASGDRHGSAA